jgi:ABC-2 type transport system ATP-binding protein
MLPVISTTGLTRDYQTYVKREGLKNSVLGFFNRQHQVKHALLATDVEIRRGEVVGLVGANGAGKTTLIKILCGLIHPSKGSCSVLGMEPWKRSHQLLRRISVLLGQKAQLWWDIPPADSFELLGRIYGVERSDLRSRISELAETLNVTSQLHTQLRRLSLGERMKMEFIGSLLHRPEVLFLDEPTIGLDIVAQSSIRHFLNEYVKKESPTIILTSHYMDDISSMANRLMLMSHGSIVYDGSVNEFRARASATQKLTIRLSAPLTEAVTSASGAVLASGEDTFSVELPQDQVGVILGRILNQNQIAELNIEQSDFEDVVHAFLSRESGRSRAVEKIR